MERNEPENERAERKKGAAVPGRCGQTGDSTRGESVMRGHVGKVVMINNDTPSLARSGFARAMTISVSFFQNSLNDTETSIEQGISVMRVVS